MQNASFVFPLPLSKALHVRGALKTPSEQECVFHHEVLVSLEVGRKEYRRGGFTDWDAQIFGLFLLIIRQYNKQNKKDTYVGGKKVLHALKMNRWSTEFFGLQKVYV